MKKKTRWARLLSFALITALTVPSALTANAAGAASNATTGSNLAELHKNSPGYHKEETKEPTGVKVNSKLRGALASNVGSYPTKADGVTPAANSGAFGPYTDWEYDGNGTFTIKANGKYHRTNMNGNPIYGDMSGTGAELEYNGDYYPTYKYLWEGVYDMGANKWLFKSPITTLIIDESMDAFPDLVYGPVAVNLKDIYVMGKTTDILDAAPVICNQNSWYHQISTKSTLSTRQYTYYDGTLYEEPYREYSYDITIHGYAGSTTDQYCKRWGKAFVSIDTGETRKQTRWTSMLNNLPTEVEEWGVCYTHGGLTRYNPDDPLDQEIKATVDSLTKGTSSDMEAAAKIVDWVCCNIKYDTSDHSGGYSVAKAWQYRKGVCSQSAGICAYMLCLAGYPTALLQEDGMCHMECAVCVDKEWYVCRPLEGLLVQASGSDTNYIDYVLMATSSTKTTINYADECNGYDNTIGPTLNICDFSGEPLSWLGTVGKEGDPEDGFWDDCCRIEDIYGNYCPTAACLAANERDGCSFPASMPINTSTAISKGSTGDTSGSATGPGGTSSDMDVSGGSQETPSTGDTPGGSTTEDPDNPDDPVASNPDNPDDPDTPGDGEETHAHDWQLVDTGEPTCTSPGYEAYECACGESKMADIPATGHKYRTTTTKATTTKDGEKVTACTECGKVKSKTTIPRVKSVTLSKTSYAYDGKAKKPAVTVKDRTGKKLGTSAYSVKYASGRKAIGTYQVTVTLTGEQKGSVTKAFTITPKTAAISALSSPKAGQLKVTAKKDSAATGYEIQAAKNTAFTSGKKTATLTKNTATTKTFTGLSKKKTYYVRARAYKTVNGKKIYGAWSTAKKTKTK